MPKLAALALLATLPVLAACQSCETTPAQFWQVRDAATGATAYVVDTPGVSFETIHVRYVDGNGEYVAVNDIASKTPMTQAEWVAATKGATWTLRYCGIRKSCWASVDAR